MAIEEPQYEVLAETPAYDVRRYAPYLVAEVDVAGEKTDNRAFRILAGYIFGDNTRSEKMQMTAPVESRARSVGEEMAMTAPVLSRSGAPAGTTYAFVMESRYTLATLPRPNDGRIRLLERPGRIVAVRRFSGRWSDANVAENRVVLLEALVNDGVNLSGDFEFARYNGPFTPWFLRRNELWIPIEWPVAAPPRLNEITADQLSREE